jgi:hypothetical protein
MKIFSTFRSALWYRKSLPMSAALLYVVWYVIGHVCCLTITAAVVTYSSDHVCCFTILAAIVSYDFRHVCILHIWYEGLKKTADIPVNLARIWTREPRIWSERSTYPVATFGTALEELTGKNICNRPKFPGLLYVLSHLLLVARLRTSGDMPSLLYTFITCTGITLHFTFALFTVLNGTVF